MDFDIHIHTNCSDGVNSPEDVIEHAKKIGLDAIAITDHYVTDGNAIARQYANEKELNIMVLPGVELSSLGGHILCLGSTLEIKTCMRSKDIVEKIHESGGIAIAVHPYDSFRVGVGDLVYKLDFDAIEIHNGHTIRSSKNVEEIADELGLPKTGGSDAHSLREIGNIYMSTDVKVNSIEDAIDAILGKKTEIVVKSGIERMWDYGFGTVEKVSKKIF